MKKYKKEIQNNNLTYLIDICGYDRKEIVNTLGLKSCRALIRWEKGESIPDAITAIRLAVILKTNPESIYPDFRNRLIKEMEDVEKSRKPAIATSAKK